MTRQVTLSIDAKRATVKLAERAMSDLAAALDALEGCACSCSIGAAGRRCARCRVLLKHGRPT